MAKGMWIVSEVYKAAKFFLEDERYGMRSQTTRCAVSIPSNIAEGSAKKSGKEYGRYIETSLGSSFELESHLLIIQEQGWFPEEVINNLLKNDHRGTEDAQSIFQQTLMNR